MSNLIQPQADIGKRVIHLSAYEGSGGYLFYSPTTPSVEKFLKNVFERVAGKEVVVYVWHDGDLNRHQCVDIAKSEVLKTGRKIIEDGKWAE